MKLMVAVMVVVFVVCVALAVQSGGRTLAVLCVALLGYGLALAIPVLAQLARLGARWEGRGKDE
jgi:hypothetical protein